MSKNMHRFTVFTQPDGAPSPAVLGVLPRRVAWTNKKADGKYRILMQMPYPNISEGNCHGMEDPPHLFDRATPAEVQEAKNICHDLYNLSYAFSISERCLHSDLKMYFCGAN